MSDTLAGHARLGEIRRTRTLRKGIEMTRKDFQLIADVIAQFQPEDGKAMVSPDLMAGAMATALATTNPNFDRERFLKACKGGE